MVIVGVTVTPESGPAIPTVEVALRRPVDVVGNHEIQAAVVIVVKPRGARCPEAGIFHSGSRRYVGESTVPVIVIENTSTVAEHEQVGESVIVIIANRDTHAEKTLGAYARFPSYICEGAISIIPVERAAQRLLRAVHASSGTVHQIEIE